MSDQIEEVIREIAAKHGIAVARDDPILVLQTINNRLLQDSTKVQQEQLDRFKEAIEGVSLRWQSDAKEKAERIVNASLAASRDAMDQIMHEGGKAAALAICSEMNRALEQITLLANRSRHSALLSFASSSVGVVLVAISLWLELK